MFLVVPLRLSSVVPAWWRVAPLSRPRIPPEGISYGSSKVIFDSLLLFLNHLLTLPFKLPGFALSLLVYIVSDLVLDVLVQGVLALAVTGWPR